MAFERYGSYERDDNKEWIADSKADLKDLPMCRMGSTCYVIAEAAVYMRNSKGEWVLQKRTSGGGSEVVFEDETRWESI